MDWITDTIAIGNFLEAQDGELLTREGFNAILSLDGSLTLTRAEELGVARIVATTLIDGPGNDLRVFAGAVESLVFLVQLHAPVLVHCHAGRSRSVAVVAGYLMRMSDLDPIVALDQVKAKREAKVADALVDMLYKLSAN